LDLSRFDAALLIAFTATKETDYGTETDGRISARCGAYRADQWAYTQAGGLRYGVGMLTLNKWIVAHQDTDVVSKEYLTLAQENDRL
jgi:hypothetical protein